MSDKSFKKRPDNIVIFGKATEGQPIPTTATDFVY